MSNYWGKEGKFQSEYDELFKLIPFSGPVKNFQELETLRLHSNWYYDVYNNGGGNYDVRLLEAWDSLSRDHKTYIKNNTSLNWEVLNSYYGNDADWQDNLKFFEGEAYRNLLEKELDSVISKAYGAFKYRGH